jgi:hypothetical protein
MTVTTTINPRAKWTERLSPNFSLSAVMGEDVLGEHRAQSQHLVRVRTHHRRNDARAQNALPARPARMSATCAAERRRDREFCRAWQSQARREKRTAARWQENGDGIGDDGAFERADAPRGKTHDGHVRKHDRGKRDQRVTPEGLRRHSFARHQKPLSSGPRPFFPCNR